MALDFEADMDDIFLQSGFEETVTYHALGAATGVEMSAVVFREGYTESPKFNNSSVRKYKIALLISGSDLGVESITTKEDYFDIYEKKNDTTTKKYHVSGIIYDDAGGWMVGVG